MLTKQELFATPGVPQDRRGGGDHHGRGAALVEVLGDSPLDFASADSAMGHVADLALGIALAQPHRRVICLNGDGSLLMTLGSLATVVEAEVRNLILFTVENRTFEITGNQAIAGGRPGGLRRDGPSGGFRQDLRFR